MYTYHMIFCSVFQESFAQMVKFQAIYQHTCDLLYKKKRFSAALDAESLYLIASHEQNILLYPQCLVRLPA